MAKNGSDQKTTWNLKKKSQKIQKKLTKKITKKLTKIFKKIIEIPKFIG